MGNKYILNFTPTGMIPVKKMTPHVPIQVDEIVEQVLAVVRLGVNMIHLHARDPVNQPPPYKKTFYAEMIRIIRTEYPDLLICVTTSGMTLSLV